MFNLRNSEQVSYDELARQQVLYNFIINNNRFPQTKLEFEIAAIVGHKSIDPITVEKLKQLPDLKKELSSSTTKLTVQFIQRYYEQIKRIGLLNSMVFQLHVPLNIQKPTESCVNVEAVRALTKRSITIRPANNVTLRTFETHMFGNLGKEKYTDQLQFPGYVYINTQRYIKIVPFIENDWRPMLMELIEIFEFDLELTFSLFEQDEITYNNIVYDVRIIPKYDVRRLTTVCNVDNVYDQRMNSINYRNALTINSTTVIDQDHIDIFKIFPFKNSHYINGEDGSIHYMDVPSPTCVQTKYTCGNICNTNELNSILTSVIQYEKFDDLLSLAVHSDDLQIQGIALLALNLMQGPTLELMGFTIKLPYMQDVMSWIKLSCDNTKILLPILKVAIEESILIRYITFIQTIATMATNCKQVSFMCSPFIIPACFYQPLLDRLTAPTERFVLTTLLCQNYPNYSYIQYRDRIEASSHFEQNASTESPHQSLGQLYNDFLKRTPVIMSTEKIYQNLVEPNCYYDCSIENCPELYEPVDPQLKELIATGKTTLTYEQNVAYVALLIHKIK